MDWKKIATVITVVFTISIATSGYLTSGFGLLSKIDSRYAKASEFKHLTIKVQAIHGEVKLNHLHQLKSTAFAEYFAAKKLKKMYPNDSEVDKILERAISDKTQLSLEYVEMKKKVAALLAKLQK